MKSVIAISTLCILAGCQSYQSRSDFISEYTGDAIAANRALQVIDPWPRYVNDTTIMSSGQRQADVLKKYHTKHKEDESAALPLASLSQVQPPVAAPPPQ